MNNDARHPPDDLPAGEAAAWCLLMVEAPLDARDQERFQSWLAADPRNPARFDSVAAFWSEMDAQRTAPRVIRMREAALSAYRRAQTRRWANARTWRDLMARPRFAAAVASVLLLYAAVHLMTGPLRYETNIGERRTVMLADGSRLSLDADSELSVRYSAARRDLVLKRGRASFVVARNAARPFSVSSGDYVVVATGTAFTVERLSGDTEVTLQQGHVRVSGRGGAPILSRVAGARGVQPAEVLLTPGRRLTLSRGQPIAQVADAEGGATPQAWEAGQLEFDNETLSHAAERINRYATDRRIAVAADAANARVSGIFNAGATQVFASEMAATFGLDALDDGRVITLSRQSR